MNESAVRQLAQQDPVANLTGQYGEVSQQARKHLDYLITALRALDSLTDTLAEHGIVVTVDLGAIGNAAAAARRDLERDTGRTFELPRHDRG